ncbi:hypothetical protein HU200_003969 [Digitaria exilis]|uniref:Uncharacterized protein n=1 Tax=Digitaria exilis TaxID=1010633 RepID=A0A835FU62_9POAL|nr:hypothetical protein HU200_003969 [Digitaria exilis]
MPAERLDVVVASRTLVRASDPPPGFPAVLQASNLDLIFGSFHVFFVSVYPAPAAGFAAVAAAARAALPTFLSIFFPFAGRVVADASTGVPEISCNNAGAELVAGHAAVPLPDVHFADADRSVGAIPVPFEHDLALSLQLVRFACGGFSLSWGSNHLLPHHERASLFRPRSPPRHSTSLDAEFTRYAPEGLPNSLLVATLVRRNYVVSGADVARLRAAASTATRRATRLEALSAHVWKLLAVAVGDSDTHCRMAWPVDGRARLDPAKYDRDAGRRGRHGRLGDRGGVEVGEVRGAGGLDGDAQGGVQGGEEMDGDGWGGHGEPGACAVGVRVVQGGWGLRVWEAAADGAGVAAGEAGVGGHGGDEVAGSGRGVGGDREAVAEAGRRRGGRPGGRVQAGHGLTAWVRRAGAERRGRARAHASLT